jgi:cytochrome c-type biogenesis protein CcmH/NrfF
MNPNANNPGVRISIEPPHKVANQLKIFMPVGIAIIMVAAVKYIFGKRT